MIRFGISVKPDWGKEEDASFLDGLAARVGIERMAEADLGVRVHRNRPLDELAPMALAVLRTVLQRAGVDVAEHPTLIRPGEPPVVLDDGERPPLATVEGYRTSP